MLLSLFDRKSHLYIFPILMGIPCFARLGLRGTADAQALVAGRRRRAVHAAR